MAFRAFAFLVLVARVGAAPAKAKETLLTKRIAPKLSPESDEKFMKHDLPADQRPSAKGMEFEHPYPVVQEDVHYDSDYVKDENNDNGEYKAQTDYDTLRNKLAKEKKDVVTAEAKKKTEDAEVTEAQKAEKAAEEESKKADAKAEAAKKESDTAKKELEKVEGKKGEVAEKEVKKDVDNLEGCKAELAAARAKLKEAMDKKAESDKAAEAAGAERKAALQTEGKAQMSEEEMEKSVAQQEAEHVAAVEKYEGEVKALEKSEKELEEAEANLRKSRRDKEVVDQDGGVYRTKKPAKSGAASLSVASAAVLATAVLYLC